MMYVAGDICKSRGNDKWANPSMTTTTVIFLQKGAKRPTFHKVEAKRFYIIRRVQIFKTKRVFDVGRMHPMKEWNGFKSGSYEHVHTKKIEAMRLGLGKKMSEKRNR